MPVSIMRYTIDCHQAYSTVTRAKLCRQWSNRGGWGIAPLPPRLISEGSQIPITCGANRDRFGAQAEPGTFRAFMPVASTPTTPLQNLPMPKLCEPLLHTTALCTSMDMSRSPMSLGTEVYEFHLVESKLYTLFMNVFDSRRRITISHASNTLWYNLFGLLVVVLLVVVIPQRF